MHGHEDPARPHRHQRRPMIIQRDGLRSDAIGQYLVLSLGKLPESSVDTPKETPALRAVGSAGSSPYSAESTVETSPSGPVSLTVLTKSLTVRALEIGPRGPADDARPSLSAPCVLTGPGVPCPQHLLASPGPVSPMLLHGLGILLPSRLTRFLFCSTMSGSPGTTSPRSSLLIPLVSWNSFYASPLRSLRTLSSPHSSGDRPAPRQPRPVTTVVPCLSNNLPTAGGVRTRTSRGKLAPGNHPADTPSGSTVLSGAFGSSSSSSSSPSPSSLRRMQSL